MTIYFRPATLADLGAVKPVLPGRLGRLVAAQILQWPCLCADVDGKPAALMGAAPAGEAIDQSTEIWFAIAADLQAAVRVPLLREILMRGATFREDANLVVRIRDDNPSGHKIARLMGFKPTPEVWAGGVRTWVRSGLPKGIT